MNKPITAQEFFPNVGQLMPAERTRLEELVSVSNLLVTAPVDNGQTSARIPLSHFNFFAPYFLGIKPVGDEFVANNDVLRNMWLGCCGTLQHDVMVMNDQTGEHVFTVPSYFDSSIINVDPGAALGDSFGRLRRRMENERNFPEHAVSVFEENTKKRVESLIGTQPPADRHQVKARMWTRIFSFYGVTPTAANGNSSIPSQQGLNSSSVVDSGFGGFGDGF